MPKLRIRLFGRSYIHDESAESIELEAGKVLELLGYLVIFRARPHPREGLAELLWGHMSSTAQSKKYLRQTIWQLQQTLSRCEAPAQPLLLVEADWLRLNPDYPLWLDVAVLEEAAALTRGVPGNRLNDYQAQALSAAAEVYAGDLLEGWYQDWCLFERERLQSLYLGLLDKLMGYCEAHHDLETGIDYGTRILRFDRAREYTHRRLMLLHALAGDRTAALRQYHRCVAALDETLNVGPATATEALYKRIRDNAVPDTSDGGQRLPGLLAQLRQIELRLNDTQVHLREGIASLERAIGESEG
jgi:DNA-binding SARP family transcriptional activator